MLCCPERDSFKDASTVLYSTRSGVAWSALGHATACYEAALSYSQQRMQFGKPLAKFQMVQERLTQMLDELTAMQLYCRHMADLETGGRPEAHAGVIGEVPQHARGPTDRVDRP